MSSIEKRRTIIGFAPWELEEQEQWLMDQALLGWHLESISIGFLATFVRGDASDTRYRCEVTTETIPDEQLELYRQSGWEHVASRARVHIFRSAGDSSIPEIHTDPSEQALTLRPIIYSLSLTVVLLIAIGVISLALGLRRGVLIPRIILNWQWTNVLYLFLVLSVTVQSAIDLVSTCRTKRWLQRGLPLTRPVEYKVVLKRRIRRAIVFVALLAILLAGKVSCLLAEHKATNFPPVPEYPIPLVKLGQLLVAQRITDFSPYRSPLEHTQVDGDVFNYFRTRTSLLSPTQYELYETFKGSDEDSLVQLHSYRYEAASPAVARLLAETLAQHSFFLARFGFFWDNKPPGPRLTEQATSHKAYRLWHDEAGQTFLLLKDNVVIYCLFSRTELMDSLIDLTILTQVVSTK